MITTFAVLMVSIHTTYHITHHKKYSKSVGMTQLLDSLMDVFRVKSVVP